MDAQLPAQITGAVPAVAPNSNAVTGNTYVTSDAYQTPQIVLLQQMSPQVQPGGDAHVPGAEPGQFMIAGMNKLLGRELLAVNAFFRVRHILYTPRAAGGGFVASHLTREAAENQMRSHGSPLEYSMTHEHIVYLYLQDDQGQTRIAGPFLFGMASSKLQTSRAWNSLISRAHSHRPAKIWKLESFLTSNARGQFFTVRVNETVPGAGWTNESDFQRVMEMTEQLTEQEKTEREGAPVEQPAPQPAVRPVAQPVAQPAPQPATDGVVMQDEIPF